MEIAAAAGPPPKLLIAATGDWTRATLAVEGPAIQHIYELFDAANAFHFVRFDYNHNYNRTSRETVYSWLGHRFLPKLDDAALKEQPYQKEPDADLRVFLDGKLPPDAITRNQLIDYLKKSHQKQLSALLPSDAGGLKKFKTAMTPAWTHTLQIEWPAPPINLRRSELRNINGLVNSRLRIDSQTGNEFGATFWAPETIINERAPRIVILAATISPLENSTDQPSEQARKWLSNGMAVLEFDCSGEHGAADQFSNFYTTYNRTTLQRRAANLIPLSNAPRSGGSPKPCFFKGSLFGEGGPPLSPKLW